MVTQKPVNQTQALALPTTEAGMLARVDEAKALGPLWAKDMTAPQRRALALTALAYGLDPLMEELILYQGKLLITIKGRRRKDAETGHRPTIQFRFLRKEEEEGFMAAGAIVQGDLAQICLLTTEWGNTVEGFGKVTLAERRAPSRNPNARDPRRSPVVDDNPVEMCQKRAEARAREMAYGMLPRLQLPAGADVIEGEGRLVEELPGPAETIPGLGSPHNQGTPGLGTDLATCAFHGNLRMGVDAGGRRCHRLPGGEFCYGRAATAEERDSSVPSPDEGAGDAPADFPPGQAEDEAALRAAVASAGQEFEYWCQNNLMMPLARWRASGKTIRQALALVQGYRRPVRGG